MPSKKVSTDNVLEANVINPLSTFAKSSYYFIKKCEKPDRKRASKPLARGEGCAPAPFCVCAHCVYCTLAVCGVPLGTHVLALRAVARCRVTAPWLGRLSTDTIRVPRAPHRAH